MNIFLTADTHFGHANIIKYCKRPFDYVEDMDAALETLWNETVKPNDVVYHLGDISFSKTLPKLNGKITLVCGNHESTTKVRKWLIDGKLNAFVKDTMQLERFTLSHHPVYDWMPRLCGHVHEKFLAVNNMINVGVDVWKFKPVAYEEVVKLYENIQPGLFEKAIRAVTGKQRTLWLPSAPRPRSNAASVAAASCSDKVGNCKGDCSCHHR